jgi:hypothetical protein
MLFGLSVPPIHSGNRGSNSPVAFPYERVVEFGIGGCDANPLYSGSNSIVTERKNSLNKSHSEGIFTGNASSVSQAAGKSLFGLRKTKNTKTSGNRTNVTFAEPPARRTLKEPQTLTCYS